MKLRLLCRFTPVVEFAVLMSLSASALCQESPKTQKLPSVQQVMDHYVAAIGGHDVIFKHRSMTIRGKFEVSEKGPSLDRYAYYKDGKMLFEIVLPNGSRYQEGYDGTVAWQVDPQSGAAISEGNEVKSTQRDADMYYPGRILDYFSSMEVVDVTDFEGHACYHLKGTNKWGIVNEHFYDTSSGLLIGYRFNSKWRGGPGDEIEVFSDYKDCGGWLRPTREVHKSAEGVQAQTTTWVSYDDVADSVFAVPDAVKALLAKKGQK